MKRRNFIINSGITYATSTLFLNGLSIGTLPHSNLMQLVNSDNDRVLVLIQLQGGNDGLNTVIPMSSLSTLSRHRPNLIIAENQILSIDDSIGFHHHFGGMKDLYQEGKLNIVHSVGYPNQNRSHFRSTDIWTSGSGANEIESRGWLGKYLDSQYAGFPENFPNDDVTHPIAITMGGITSETCQGVAANFSLALSDPFGLAPLAQGQGSSVPDSTYGEELAYLRDAISKTNAYTEIITDAAKMGNTLVGYPNGNDLANQLKNVATLISGGLKTKIYVCTIGGFDTHANQVEDGDSATGIHAYLLKDVSEAIHAFQNDLKELGLEKRVMGMTFSEFGRQIASNGSLGTDHGTAAPMFLFGSCVMPGNTGLAPDIPDQIEPQQGVTMQIDFRDVYGTILHKWFELEKDDVKEMLFSEFQELPLLGNCQTTPTEEVKIENSLEIFPNPFVQNLSLTFTSEGKRTRVSIFDMRGAEVLVVFERTLRTGIHKFKLDLSHLTAGTYFLQIKSGGFSKGNLIVKLAI